MSYSKDLDEYTTMELMDELVRRANANAKKLCSYCGRGRKTKPCKFKTRHRGIDP